MAPERPGAPLRRALPFILAAILAAPSAAHARRIVNWNVTNFPGSTGAARVPHFRTVLAPLGADVVVVQEMLSQAGVNQFLADVLDALEPGQWAAAPFINGNDTDNALFYKPSRVQFLGGWAFYPDATRLRLVNCYRLKPVGYAAAAAELRLYSQHLKASQGSTNEARRLSEATGIRDSMNAVPPGTHAILLGDFNIYRSSEPAYQKFLESQANNAGRVYDPLDAPGDWHANPAFAAIHTQCPCLSCPTGFAGGGLDDRFDMFLPTYNLGDGQGLDVLASTYVAVGNDGLHFDRNITDPPVIPEGSAYATALWNASDHLPIRVDVQVPARIQVAATLDLGTVIVGGGGELRVENPALPPADALSYSLAPPAGFTAAAGPHELAAGAPAAQHAIRAAPGPPGPRSGDLIVATDDPDRPAVAVGLSADVRDHAAASLDSLRTALAATLDFGERPPGGFATGWVTVHNFGFDGTQARLSVESGTITGGAGRFSLVGGFDPALVGEAGEPYAVAFADSGAVRDSTYEAMLVFSSADEPLPGAAAQPDLVVTLRARPLAGPLSAGGAGVPPRTRLHPPAPNPAAGPTSLRFDLAAAARARLEVFDLAGRRVALVADRDFAPGIHAFAWDGAAGRPAAGPGLYFVRLSVPGQPARTARLAVVR